MRVSRNKKKERPTSWKDMLFFFVSADNRLTQKEVRPSMWKDRKLLDTMLAILHEEFHLVNEWISVAYYAEHCAIKNTQNRL